MDKMSAGCISTSDRYIYYLRTNRVADPEEMDKRSGEIERHEKEMSADMPGSEVFPTSIARHIIDKG
jgi:hypothetical protein